MKAKNRSKSLDWININFCRSVFCGKHSNKNENQTINVVINYLHNVNNNFHRAINNNDNDK